MSFRQRWHERLVYLRNRPLEYLFTRATRYLGAVVHVPRVGYFINDARIAREILTDSAHFSISGAGGMGDFLDQMLGRPAPTLFNLDGTRHKQLKSIVQREITSRVTATRISELLSSDLQQLREQLEAGCEIDVVPFVQRISTLATAHLMGIHADTEHFEALIEQVSQVGHEVTRVIAVRSGVVASRHVRHAQSLYSGLEQLLVRHLEQAPQPLDSLVARLRQAGLSNDETQVLLLVLLIAGTETLSVGIPRTVAMLLDGGLWTECKSTPANVRAAVDEGFRLSTPSPFVLYSAVRSQTVQGYDFRAGRRVFVALFNILRDRRYIESPYAFRFDRKADPIWNQLWFGAGAHFCPGATVSRAVSHEVLSTLAKVDGQLRITGRRVARRTSFPGYESLRLKQVPG